MNTETAPDIVARIDALLPQTQCTRCGYPGCRPYAAAIASGEARDQSMPAGRQRHHCRAWRHSWAGPCCRLNPVNGVESPPRVAWIDEVALHRLRTLPRALSGGRHRRRAKVHAHRSRRALHGLRAVPAALPGGLHRNAAGTRSPRRIKPALNRARFDAHSARLLNRAVERQRELDAKKAAAPRRPGRTVNAAKRRAIFARLRAANPEPRTELNYQSPFELLVAVILSAQATDKSVNKATAALFRAANTPAAMLALGVEGLSRVYQVDRAVQQQGQEHHRHLPAAARAARRRRARVARGTRAAAGRRQKDRQCHFEHGVRRSHHGGGHAHLSSRQSHRIGTRQDGARGGGKALEIRAAGVSQGRASLVDSARTLRLQGAQSGVPHLSDRGPLRVSSQIPCLYLIPTPASNCARPMRMRGASTWRTPRSPARGHDHRRHRRTSRISGHRERRRMRRWRSSRTLLGGRESVFTYGAASRGSRAGVHRPAAGSARTAPRCCKRGTATCTAPSMRSWRRSARRCGRRSAAGRPPDEAHYLALARRHLEASPASGVAQTLSKLHPRFIGAAIRPALSWIP